jgi:uncharacterized protein YqeY
MRAEMRADLTAALKARDRVTAAALRSVLAAIENGEAVPVDPRPASAAGGEHVAGAAVGAGAAEAQRRPLTDADLRSIVEGEVRERVRAAEEYERLGRDDAAGRLRVEIEVLRRYL